MAFVDARRAKIATAPRSSGRADIPETVCPGWVRIEPAIGWPWRRPRPCRRGRADDEADRRAGGDCAAWTPPRMDRSVSCADHYRSPCDRRSDHWPMRRTVDWMRRPMDGMRRPMDGVRRSMDWVRRPVVRMPTALARRRASRVGRRDAEGEAATHGCKRRGCKARRPHHI
jgi:hypothetical protein